MYNWINSLKSPASGAGKFTEPSQKSHVGRVREAVCAQISVFVQSERWRYQYWFAYVAAGIT